MSRPTILERLEALEAEVAQLKAQNEPSPIEQELLAVLLEKAKKIDPNR